MKTKRFSASAAGSAGWRAASSGAMVLLSVAALGSLGCRSESQPDWESRKLYQSAVVSLAQGRAGEAEAALRRVLSRNSKHTGALCKLAGLLLKRSGGPDDEQAQEAERLARRAVEIEDESPIAWDTLAQVLQHRGREQQAWQARLKVVDLDPSDARARVAAAELGQRLGKLERATELLEAGLKDASPPGRHLLTLELGLLKLRQGDLEQGRALLEAIPERAPEFRVALEQLGGLAARQGDFATVKRRYERLVEIDPGDASAWELLAAVEERQGDYAAAEQKYRRALQLQRDGIRSWTGLARCRLAANDRQQARYALQQADRLVAADPSAAPEVAELLVELGEKDWALALLSKAELGAATVELRQKLQRLRSEIEKATAGADRRVVTPADGGTRKPREGQREEQ